jgi:hypothetical protein
MKMTNYVAVDYLCDILRLKGSVRFGPSCSTPIIHAETELLDVLLPFGWWHAWRDSWGSVKSAIPIPANTFPAKNGDTSVQRICAVEEMDQFVAVRVAFCTVGCVQRGMNVPNIKY